MQEYVKLSVERYEKLKNAEDRVYSELDELQRKLNAVEEDFMQYAREVAEGGERIFFERETWFTGRTEQHDKFLVTKEKALLELKNHIERKNEIIEEHAKELRSLKKKKHLAIHEMEKGE